MGTIETWGASDWLEVDVGEGDVLTWRQGGTIKNPNISCEGSYRSRDTFKHYISNLDCFVTCWARVGSLTARAIMAINQQTSPHIVEKEVSVNHTADQTRIVWIRLNSCTILRTPKDNVLDSHISDRAMADAANGQTMAIDACDILDT